MSPLDRWQLLRCDCPNVLSMLARLWDPLNFVKSHRNPFEAGVRKYSEVFLSIRSQNSPIALFEFSKPLQEELGPFQKKRKFHRISIETSLFGKFEYIPIKSLSSARWLFEYLIELSSVSKPEPPTSRKRYSSRTLNNLKILKVRRARGRVKGRQTGEEKKQSWKKRGRNQDMLALSVHR
jgi:hypothetical protein